MSTKYTKAVTSWVSEDVYDLLQEAKKLKGTPLQQIIRDILESHFQGEAVTQTDAFKELQIEHIKNKFRLQKLYELIEKNTFESSEKYQKMVEDELQKMIQG